MTITCNGAALASHPTTVAELVLERLGDPRPDGVAVAVNGEVVPRSAWPTHPLADGDAVEVVTAVQGG